MTTGVAQGVSDREMTFVELCIKLTHDPNIPEIAKKAAIYLIRHTNNFSHPVFMRVPKTHDKLCQDIVWGVGNISDKSCNTRIHEIFKRIGVEGVLRGYLKSHSYGDNVIAYDKNPGEGTEIPFNEEAIEKISLDGTIDLDKLQEKIERLAMLLRDRQGTIAWNDFVRDRIKELQQLLF
ncbi:MAG: hypothetical protein WC242_03340 [Candidatus Paceibacterota bacterium]|jgi:hypothetical protein